MTREERIAKRLNAGLSIAEVALKAGVSKRHIVSAENGGPRPHPRNAKKVADYYGCQVTDIWPVEEEVAS